MRCSVADLHLVEHYLTTRFLRRVAPHSPYRTVVTRGSRPSQLRGSVVAAGSAVNPGS